jgi:hypothetical protein
MSKYDPLAEYLYRANATSLEMSFDQLEAIIHARLPNSARELSAWWSNDESTTHVQANSWLDAGWQVRHFDLANEHVVFVRIYFPYGNPES